MSRSRHDKAAPVGAASPANSPTDAGTQFGPRRKGRTPGRKDPAFSPHQFLALTQTGTDPKPDPDLWLTEEEVKVVHPRGILILGQYFYHEKLDRYVTGKTPEHKRPKIMIRYDRAMLARHILEKVSVYLEGPDRVYQPLCTAELREDAMARVDRGLATVYRNRYEQILARKRTRAQQAYFGTESGDEAVARLRELQAARTRQRTARTQRPATPEQHLDAKTREKVNEAVQEMAANFQAGHAARQAEDQQPDPTAPAAPAAPSSRGGAKAGKPRGSKSRRAGSASRLSPAPKISQPAGRTPSAGSPPSGVLPTRTGFHTETEE